MHLSGGDRGDGCVDGCGDVGLATSTTPPTSPISDAAFVVMDTTY